jgi:hypothetical protein
VRHVNNAELSKVLSYCSEHWQLKIHFTHIHVFVVRHLTNTSVNWITIPFQLFQEFGHLMAVRSIFIPQISLLHCFAATRTQLKSRKLGTESKSNALDGETGIQKRNYGGFMFDRQLSDSFQVDQT